MIGAPAKLYGTMSNSGPVISHVAHASDYADFVHVSQDATQWSDLLQHELVHSIVISEFLLDFLL